MRGGCALARSTWANRRRECGSADAGASGRTRTVVHVCGFGFSLFQTPTNREFIGTVDHEKLADASSLPTFCRSVGLTFGPCLPHLWHWLPNPGMLADARAVSAHHISVRLAAGAAMLATAVSAFRLRRA